MKIKSVNILNFGPLKNVVVNNLSPEVNIIRGKNDSGKSLFTEAICALLKKKGKNKTLPIRTETDTDSIGAITIEHNATEITLQGERIQQQQQQQQQKKKKVKNCEEIDGIRLEEFLALNNSALFETMETKDQITVFNSICTRLIDDKSKQIQMLQKKVKELGGLTETKLERNQQIAAMEEKIKEVERKIEELTKYFAENKLESLDIDLKLALEQQETAQKSLEKFKNTKYAYIYKEGSTLINKINQTQQDLDKYKHITQEAQRIWINNLQFIKEYTEEAENIQKTIQELETQINSYQKQYEEQRTKHEQSKKELEFINQNMHKIQALEKNHEFTAQIKKYQKYLFIATGISLLFTLLFPLLYLVTRDRTLSEISIPIGIVTALIFGSLIASIVFIKRNGDLEADLRTQFIQAIQSGENTAATAFDTLLPSKQLVSFCISRKKQLEQSSGNYYSLQATITQLSDNLSQNRQKLEELTRKIATKKHEIADIKQKTGTETTEELNQKLQESARLKSELDMQISQLTAFAQAYLDLFQQYNTKSLLNLATEKIRMLRQYEPHYQQSFMPNTAEEEKIRETLDNAKKIALDLESKKRLQEAKFDDIFRLILEITRGIRSLNESMKLSLELGSHIEFTYINAQTKEIINTIPFAKQTLDICKSLMEKIRQETTTAIEVCQILEQILQEEQEKRNKFLIQSEFPAYFNNITGITLTNIETQNNTKAKEFLCLEYTACSESSSITEINLGTGSIHQLYLCLSLMIMNKLHEQQPGFLILDNPFLGADDERAIKIVELLNEFRNNKWQLLITVNTERDFANCISGFAGATIKKFEMSNFKIAQIL